ncbi:MAG: ATP-binding protein [Acidobacteriota bacterium]|jgi:two-component system NtrC family sensor kinase
MSHQHDDEGERRAAAAAALRHTERLASIGALADGISHELKNLLGGILMAAQYANTALDRPDARAVVEKALSDIASDARRCSEVVADLLQFVRDGGGDRVDQELAPIVADAIDLAIKSAVDSSAAVRFEPDEALPRVAVDRVEIRQALVSVLSNALHSGSSEVLVRARAGTNDRVLISVTDDGIGVPEAELGRVFEPTFPATAPYRGLSLAHAIVTDHGGAIDVASSSSGGTSVTLTLPLAQGT